MSSEQQSCLRFSVEESIWFQKGQEVSELISIALDPDIQIYEQDQYVSIRGALLLSGEYHVNAEDEEEEYRPQARVVQEVEEREGGVCSLKHRFPVDITIPKNRIQSLDDIYVAIESFDYSVPARGCLQLDAELSISGIYGHQQSSPAWEEQQSKENAQSYAQEHAYTQSEDEEEEREEQQELETQELEQQELKPLELEQQQLEPQEEAQEYEPLYRSSQTDNEFEEDAYQYYTEEDDEEEEILNQHEIDANVQYDYNNEGEYEPFEIEARKNPVEEVEEAYNPNDYLYDDGGRIEAEDPFSPLYSLKPTKKEEPSEEATNIVSFFEKRKETQAVAEVKEQEQEQHDEARDENDLSLTKIFAHEEGEEFTRLKICIVQQGESIDHIAERYEVTIQQLIRINRLSTEDNVSEGQLLYIPVKAVSKT